MTRLVRPVLVVLLGVLLLMAPGVAAYAYWSITATGTLAVGTAALPVTPNPPGTPAQPTQSTSSCGTAALDWSSVVDATGYRVYRRTGSAPSYTYTLLATATDSAATINQGALPASTIVVVTAYNAHGESGYSMARTVTFTACPTPPVISCGSRQNASSFSIRWGNVPGAVEYRIYRSTDNATFALVATSTGSTANLAISSVGITYWRLTAVVGANESSPSNTLKITKTGNGAGGFGCGAP